jgi:hypothetical protein
MLLKLFHKTERERMPPNSFYVVRITLTPKPDKGKTNKQIYGPISLRNTDAKIHNQICKSNSVTLERPCAMINLVSFQGCKDGSIHAN